MQTSVVSCSPQVHTVGGASSAYRDFQRSQSLHVPVPVDPATCLQHLEEDVRRDVAAAQQRSALLQEEVDSLLARIAAAQESAAVVQGDNDVVMQRVEAIRKLRQE